MNPKKEIRQKLLLLGDSGVGKTCIWNRYFFNTFNERSTSTMGIINKKKQFDNFEDVSIILDIWDTSGQERYRAMTKMDYHSTDGIIYVFDLTTLESFKKITLWIREAKLHIKKDYMKLLVGNKSDKENRQVSEEEITAFTKEWDFYYLETSAKNNKNISEIFNYFENEIHRRYIKEQKEIDISKEDKNRIIIEKYNQDRKIQNSCGC